MLSIKDKISSISALNKGFLRYIIVALIILLSNLIWYNFGNPPISANTGFPINTLRFLKYYYLPFNFYSWPVSYNPMVNYFPFDLTYSVLNSISLDQYSVSFFIYNVSFEVAGAFSLFYLTSKLFKNYGIPEIYSYISVLFYAFNVSIFIDGGTFETGTAELLIILFLLYLIIYRNKIYILLLGFLSFFIFYPFPGGYPDGATILLEEFVIICILILLKEFFLNKDMDKKKNTRLIGLILLSIGTVAISLSYILFIIFASGSTLIANSVSLKPAYVFGFIYDWIAVLPNSMRLILDWGSYTVYSANWTTSYLGNPFISFFLYFFPFFSLSSIIFLKKKDYYIYILLVLSIFAATSSNPPFGYLFEDIMLYVGPLRVFYESDAYYPILIIFYSILVPFTFYNFLSIIKSYHAIHSQNRKRRINFQLNKKTDKVYALVLILIILIPAFPMYTGLIDKSGPVMPVESSIPNYYFNANNYLQSSGRNSPVMVFPGINGFSSYQTAGHTWYQGTDIYPAVISNPSISDDISGSYTIGRGDAYSIISYVYGRPISQIQKSFINTSSLSTSNNFITSNESLIKWDTNYSTDNVTFKTKPFHLDYKINRRIYQGELGSHQLIGHFTHSINLSKYNYLVLKLKTSIPTSSFEVGFINSNGDLIYLTNMNNFLPTITPNFVSEIPIYLGQNNEALDTNNISSIVFIYHYQSGEPINFNVLFYSLNFVKSEVSYPTIIARGMNILGVEYAYVDKGILDPYGQFNGSGYNSIFENSSIYKLNFRLGTVSIYSYSNYKGLISSYSQIDNYENESSLFGNLFFNISSNITPLYGLNRPHFIGSSTSSVTNYIECSPTKFVVNISYKGKFAIFFKEGYNPNWVALNSSGKIINTHFEADGYGNGWIISNNTSKIVILYRGASFYSDLVTVSIIIPFIMFSALTFQYIRIKIKKRRRF
jgi:hypothetical protein